MRRKTEEVEIRIELKKKMEVATGDQVLDHLLTTLLFYLDTPGEVSASWDMRHHLWEDTGLLLGEALREDLEGTKITRYGSSLVPMDEALVLAAVDLSRPYLACSLDPEQKEEGFSLTLSRQFLSALSRSLEATIHLRELAGTNSHHLLEAAFKALGFALRQARQPADRIESTKGWLK